MREIKFRGKKWFGGQWVYGLYTKGTGGHCFINGFRVDPNTVGQYTGIRDINGNEIYEDDIIEVCKMPQPFGKYYVTWDSEGLWIAINNEDCRDVIAPLALYEYEITGNIFEEKSQQQDKR